MNSSREPWNQVAIIRPSSCHTSRKRSHSRASRSTAQSSTSWRIARRSSRVVASMCFSSASCPRPVFAAASTGLAFVRRSFGEGGRRASSTHRLCYRLLDCPRSRAMTMESRMGRLDGRVSIVTGGAKGIGRHYSLALAAEGARVMIADIVDGTELAAGVAAQHGANSVAAEICDVSDEAAVKRLVAATLARFGQIDVLVNNAALYAPLHEQKFTEIDVALWDKVMAVNLRGPFLMG